MCRPVSHLFAGVSLLKVDVERMMSSKLSGKPVYFPGLNSATECLKHGPKISLKMAIFLSAIFKAQLPVSSNALRGKLWLFVSAVFMPFVGYFHCKMKPL